MMERLCSKMYSMLSKLPWRICEVEAAHTDHTCMSQPLSCAVQYTVVGSLKRQNKKSLVHWSNDIVWTLFHTACVLTESLYSRFIELLMWWWPRMMMLWTDSAGEQPCSHFHFLILLRTLWDPEMPHIFRTSQCKYGMLPTTYLYLALLTSTSSVKLYLCLSVFQQALHQAGDKAIFTPWSSVCSIY